MEWALIKYSFFRMHKIAFLFNLSPFKFITNDGKLLLIFFGRVPNETIFLHYFNFITSTCSNLFSVYRLSNISSSYYHNRFGYNHSQKHSELHFIWYFCNFKQSFCSSSYYRIHNKAINLSTLIQL